MDPRKGFMELIEAVSILRAGGRDDLQLVIGGPDYPPAPGHREALTARAAALGMAEFTQIGWIDDLDAAYRQARVVAMTSLPMRGRPAEGAPLVLMEGMSHGLPAVGPNEAGIAEVVGDAGTLVDDRTPAGYAQALEPYLADSQWRARWGAVAASGFATGSRSTGRSSEYSRSMRSSPRLDGHPREHPAPVCCRAHARRPRPCRQPCARP